MKTKLIQIISSIALVAILLVTSGCTAPQGTTNAQRQAFNLGALGAAAGGIAGHQSDHTWEGAALGGALGAASGFLLGDRQDKREAAQRQAALEAEVRRLRQQQGQSGGQHGRNHAEDHRNNVPHTHKDLGITDPYHTHGSGTTSGGYATPAPNANQSNDSYERVSDSNSGGNQNQNIVIYNVIDRNSTYYKRPHPYGRCGYQRNCRCTQRYRKSCYDLRMYWGSRL